MDFPYFGLFSGSALNHIVLRAQKELSARIGFLNRHSLEVFEKIENLMWIFPILVFFQGLTWIISFSELRESWAPGLVFTTGIPSKFLKKSKIWCGFSPILVFFALKKANQLFSTIRQTWAIGLNWADLTQLNSKITHNLKWISHNIIFVFLLITTRKMFVLAMV